MQGEKKICRGKKRSQLRISFLEPLAPRTLIQLHEDLALLVVLQDTAFLTCTHVLLNWMWQVGLTDHAIDFMLWLW